MRSSCRTSAACESSPPPFSVADDRLTRGGYQSGENGAVLLRGPAVELFARWRHFLARRLASLADETLAESFRRLGIGGGFRPATDAFFLPSSRGARLMQQLKGLKREFTCPLDGHDIALASINRHEDFFARAFRIRLASGQPAHSFCAAFGLEPLTAAGLVTWGSDPAQWPRALSG